MTAYSGASHSERSRALGAPFERKHSRGKKSRALGCEPLWEKDGFFIIRPCGGLLIMTGT